MSNDLTRWSMSKSIALVLVLCAASAGPVDAQQGSDRAVMRFVDIDGYALRVQTWGLAGREPGRPVIVFEAGATNSLEGVGSGGLAPRRHGAARRVRSRGSG
jgi:hypothetical protein